MKTILSILAISIGIGGCATLPTVEPYAQEQKRKLVLAQMLIEDKKAVAAKELLTAISNAPPVTGVTDEALFRLALLNIEAGEQKIATSRAGKNLDKMLSDFPTGPWQSHAATLKGLIDAYDIALEEKTDLERTIRNLRSTNTNLSRENKELRQDLEKLKNLDLELEMKTKK
jgi:hypothetical protein